MKIKKFLIWGGSIFLLIVAGLVIYFLPAYSFFFNTEIDNIDVNLTIYRGGGGNSCLLVADSAVVVIDTKMMGSAEELYKMAKEKAGKKPIIVINTHSHGDHVKGNHYYKGSKIYIGNYDKEYLKREIAEENMPTDFIKDSLTLYLGNETVEIVNLGQAHTYNDMVIYLRSRKMLIVGDLVFNNVNPVLKTANGADVDKWMKILETILSKWEIKTIVPGHGILGGTEIARSLLQYFKDMKTAAADPAKESGIKTKYKDWTTLPGMASPSLTIDFIRNMKK